MYSGFINVATMFEFVHIQMRKFHLTVLHQKCIIYVYSIACTLPVKNGVSVDPGLKMTPQWVSN